MSAKTPVLLLAAAASTLCACQTSPRLVFGQSHTLGISIGGAASDAGAEMTVGYKDRDVAIVPVAIVPRDGATSQGAMLITAAVGAKKGRPADRDALSVLGQFQTSAKSQAPEVGLGKFFATGLAAQKLADGFACKMGDQSKCSGSDSAETEEEEPETSEEQPTTDAAASEAVN